ncbi:MAG: ATP cone domain-containing protein [Candidatus Shapirobacteria bacterium]
MYQVQKNDGRLEEFDRNKLVHGALAAGATAEEAEKIAVEIEAWVATVAVENVVKSADLRVKGLEVLRQVNPAAADSFASYRK